jgi:CDP-diacylglycerol---glycerol-3-phosphate 3-phosphatidyltransferase
MFDAKIRALYDAKMKPVGDALGRSGVNPNTITLIGVGLQLVVAVEILRGDLLFAGLLAIAAGLADSLDGAVAKAREEQSPFGALLDSTVDRLSDALLFLPIAWLYGFSSAEAATRSGWVAALALVTMVASFLVSYVKARAEGLGYDCNVGIAERAERLFLVVTGLLLDLVPVMLVILGALSVVTLLQRIFYVRSQIVTGARRVP